MECSVRSLEEGDVKGIVAEFEETGRESKTRSLFERYLSEQKQGERLALVSLAGDVFSGYLTIRWLPSYPPFRRRRIPEIADFNVRPRFRRQGTGSRLMDEAEQRISERSPVAGIGVGMTPGYGAAQRMYTLRGYVPDGLGAWHRGRRVREEDQLSVAHLVLYFMKDL